jgi:hypothetical protein
MEGILEILGELIVEGLGNMTKQGCLITLGTLAVVAIILSFVL